MNKSQIIQKKSLIYNINAIIAVLKDKINEKYTFPKKIGLTKNRTQNFRVYLIGKIENYEEIMEYTNNEPELKLILNYLKKMLILVDIVFNNQKINEDNINKIIKFNDFLENNNYIITNNLYKYILHKIIYNEDNINKIIKFNDFLENNNYIITNNLYKYILDNIIYNKDNINKIIKFNDFLENNNYIITNNLYKYILHKIIYYKFTIEEIENIIRGHLNLRNKQNNKNTFNKSTNAIYNEKLKKIEYNINKLKQVNKNLSNYTI
jgi:hypothetical protein